MTHAPDRMLERIRKLLAHAEHPSTPPAEAEAMSVKAAELMARHAIDQAMLAHAEPTRQPPERRDITVLAPYATPKSVLLSRTAAPYRVRTVIGADTGTGRACTIIGFASDLALVEVLFTSLLLQASNAMLVASAGHPRVRAFRHAFLLGYADTVGGRIHAAQRRTEEAATTGTGPSTALVLADRRDAVDRAVEQLFPRLRAFRTTISDGSGLTAGRDAGGRADLGAGRRRVATSRRELA